MARLLTILISLLIISGCQTANQPPANEAAPPPSGQQMKHPPRAEQTTPIQQKKLTNQEKAEHLIRLATEVPNVKGATAIVAGQYSIVGIDVAQQLDRSRVGTIKYAVAQALKDDPHGANVLVTADVDLVQRIRELNEDIRQGRPLSGIAEELADIAGRIMPQPSHNVEKEEQPPSRLNQERQNQTDKPKPARTNEPEQQ